MASQEEITYLKTYGKKEEFKKNLTLLEKGYPVQYLVGDVDFFDCKIKVDERVLIPRFETEFLVDKTIKYLQKLNINNPSVLEIGTGSGCISIALKKHIDCKIDAFDISNKALEVASENSKINNVDINFFQKDIQDFNSTKKYNLIISNPPYVPYDSPVSESIKYEPKEAIYAKEEGLYFYKIILEKIKNNLEDNYLIALEIGDKEGLKIKEIILKYLPNSNIKIEKDYNNYERYIFVSNQNIDVE